MSLISDIGYAIKVFLHDPLKAVTDPQNAVLEYSVEQKIAAGEDTQAIAADLEEKGFVKGSIAENIVKAGETLVKAVEWTTRMLPWIFLFGIMAIAVYYLTPIVRKVK